MLIYLELIGLQGLHQHLPLLYTRTRCETNALDTSWSFLGIIHRTSTSLLHLRASLRIKLFDQGSGRLGLIPIRGLLETALELALGHIFQVR